MTGVSVASSCNFIFPSICLFSVPAFLGKETYWDCLPTHQKGGKNTNKINNLLVAAYKSDLSQMRVKKNGDRTLKWTFGYNFVYLKRA